jgi:hypothetical protein
MDVFPVGSGLEDVARSVDGTGGACLPHPPANPASNVRGRLPEPRKSVKTPPCGSAVQDFCATAKHGRNPGV